MKPGNQKLTIGLAAIAAICIAALLFRGCKALERPMTGEPTAPGTAAKSVAIAPPTAPEPTPAESARKGQIYYHRDGGMRMSLQMAEAEGGQERALVAAGSVTDLSACWSPDGRRVAYSAAWLDPSGKRAGRSGIYLVGVDGIGAEPTPVLEEVHPPEITRLRLIDWR